MSDIEEDFLLDEDDGPLEEQVLEEVVIEEELIADHDLEDVNEELSRDDLSLDEDVMEEEHVEREDEERVDADDAEDAEDAPEEEDAESQEEEQEEQEEEEMDGHVDESGVYQWAAFTGLKVKQFSAEELTAFRKPFELGWTREVVLRAGVSSSGKKVGDVYYFSPDKRHKLRSYVNMQDYLRRSDGQLKAENFTFARQPVFRPPQEVVRHAMQRGERHVAEHVVESKQEMRSNRNSTNSESEDRAPTLEASVAEGRAKRKRVAPSRFEDENYVESPFKKKSLLEKKAVNGGKEEKKTSSGPLSLQEKRRQLQNQLLAQVHERIQEQRQDEPKEEEVVSEPTVEVKEESPEQEREEEPVVVQKSARKSISVPKEEPLEPKSDHVAEEVKENGLKESPVAGAPCSMHCPGRRGMLPNLMCSRCFCLYHLDCVPGGVFLEEPRVFVCPNCLSPDDSKKEQNGHVTDSLANQAQAVFVSTTPLLIQQPMVKPRSTFAPILPKPPSLRESAIYQQMYQRGQKKSQNGSTTKGRVPQYRVTTGPNGHSMVVKDTKVRPKPGRQTVRPTPVRPLTDNSPLLSLYRPDRPIAPIAPLKLTPQQIERQLRHLMTSQGHKRRGYREYLERRGQPVDLLLAPFESLNQVLDAFSVLHYLTVKDLIRLRQVSRAFTHLSSQPCLWRHLRLKGVQLTDWQFLAKNILEANNSSLVDFEGVRAPSSEPFADFWRNFASIVDFLKSVRVLRFGQIPSFVLEEVSAAAITDNPYNSFSALEELSVKNVLDEEQPQRETSLAFLQDFHALSNLKTLSLGSKTGFAAEEGTADLLSDVFSRMPNLETLHLTALKDFHAPDFRFLTSVTCIERLSIGSCRHWFESHVAFECLQQLSQLVELKLVDIQLDGESSVLAQTLETLAGLESLTLENLRIESSGSQIADELCSVMAGMALKTFSVSTADPLTNRLTVEILKKLDNCQKLLWKVESMVEDSGECFVQFEREEGEEDLKLMDLTFLNEVIQSELSHAFIEIIPQ